jgi:hypothetical protein
LVYKYFFEPITELQGLPLNAIINPFNKTEFKRLKATLAGEKDQLFHYKKFVSKILFLFKSQTTPSTIISNGKERQIVFIATSYRVYELIYYYFTLMKYVQLKQ